MIHLGDITKIDGTKVPLVDIVCGGSPCQDLSIAGRREGLAGARSGLFMEQIRIIKEMRDVSKRRVATGTDKYIRPRYMVWENVPGAFSSNKGEDFKAVLEETAKIADENAVIPRLEGGYKWTPSGCILGDGWSIAWRIHDAQFWGVPQRRKRIALVADFGGETAPEILFEREGVSRNTEKSGKEGEKVAGNAGTGTTETSGTISFQERAGKPGGGKGILIQNERTGALSTLNNQSVCCLNDQGGSVMGVSENVTGSLRAQEHGHQPIVYGISAYESNAMKSGNPNSGIYQAETARTLDLNGGSPACNQGGMAVVCIEGNGSRPSHQGDGWHEGDPMYTLNSTEHHAVAVENHPNDSRVKISEDGMVQTLSGRMGTGGGNVPMVMEEPYTSSKASYHQRFTHDGKAETLVASDYKDPSTVTYGLDRASFNQGMNAQFDFQIDEEKIGTQVAKGPGAVCTSVDCLNGRETAVNGTLAADARKSLNSGNVVRCASVVRRLTPLECERLQGFPDHWTDIGDWVDSKGKKHKGADSPRYKALGNSIALPFWEWMAKRMVKQIDHTPTMASLFDGIGGFPLVFLRAGCEPIWASEIEEFPIAVTKKRFSDDYA